MQEDTMLLKIIAFKQY